MDRKKVPESEQKLILLYATALLEPVTEMQLLRFLTDTALMNWFDMRLGLSDLTEGHYLQLRQHPAGILYEMTADGRMCLKQFTARIPLSRRRLMDERGALLRELFLRQQQTPADSFLLQDGRRCIRLTLTEQSDLLLEMLLILPGNREITFIQQRWQKAAYEIWRLILRRIDQNEPDAHSEENEADCMLMLPMEDAATEKLTPEICREIATETVRLLEQVTI